ncbi:hypothetical protein HOU02_gp334 [Caulobacter phage CcrBL9]|uniref:Uncharacterized protein n=1 Tax=Caulobacter phage CcrBL9 TaxID=2283270 RepID=A0A385EBY1_9CAUD|nr:hypothetical protein HOU02_gp334 [Caulobacter phage CcrBL9]AXQ69391.1 hypothetical protein CcrBL9_gp367 [Caulobacter phage CcrBL9]
MNTNPDRRSFLALLGLGVGGFSAGLGGGLLAIKPPEPKVIVANLPAIDTSNAGKYLVYDGEKMAWIKVNPQARRILQEIESHL